jgi:hypothetical protein
MDLPEFEEKQYEGALIQELVAGQPTAYPSGQVLEALVGYDVALHPGEPKIWELLDAGFPAGVVLTAGLWSSGPKTPPSADLPRDLVSLILQVKRPQRLDHWRAGQDHYWHGPYYRFHIEDRQQGQLAALERGVAGRALVRYAAAAFLTLDSLYECQRNRVVAEHSTFAAPAVLVGHRLWSYAGPGAVGYANPAGTEASGDTRETLFGRASESVTHQSLSEHVRDLAEVGGVDLGPDDWLDQITEPEQGIAAERRLAIRGWAAFAQAVARNRAEWLIVDFTV